MERKVSLKVKGSRAVDGAGVHLVRVLGHDTVKEFDPILMLDSFDSINPEEYVAGFPVHPHRGIETISYLSRGKMKHSDSLGFEDTVTDGEVQWMTAGSGIMHEEQLPKSERMLGVQLWLNMPQKDKMSAPNYHAIKSDKIKEIHFEGGYLRLLAGSYKEYQGYESAFLPVDYYDIHLVKGKSIQIDVDDDRSVMAFTLLGDANISGEFIDEKTAVKLIEGNKVTISATENKDAQVLFLSSYALNEPIFWGGPIVMNSKEELNNAFDELRNGTFIK